MPQASSLTEIHFSQSWGRPRPGCWRGGFPEASLLGWEVAAFSRVSTLPSVRVCVPIASFSRTPDTLAWGPPATSLSLNYPFKDPISRDSYILRSWELGLPHTNLGEPEPPSQNKPDPQARAVLAECSPVGGAVSSPLWEVHCGLGGVLPRQGWWSRPAQTVSRMRT